MSELIAVVRPLALGVASYVVSAIGLWFVLSYLLWAILPDLVWVLVGSVTIVPLFVSGYVGARLTRSRYRMRRIAFGIVAGLIGYGISLVATQSRGTLWISVVLLIGAATVAGVGAAIGTLGSAPPNNRMQRTREG